MKTSIFIALTLILTACCDTNHKSYEGPLVIGQHYERLNDCSYNPFKVDTLLVLDIKETYVQYRITGSYDAAAVGVVSSTTNYYFRKGLTPIP